MNEETTNITEQGIKKKKALPFIIAAAVVIIALAVGISIYNTPANRIQRQLDLGNRYLEEQQYEQAAIAFEEAIAIDERCMEAYIGGMEAYLGVGDVSGAQDFYDRTLTMLSDLDEDFLAENMDYAADIYLAADEFYGNDREKIAEVLEEGYILTEEDSRIKDKLIENYIQIGKKETEDGAYEDALTVYDRLLELDSTNAETVSGLCECLNKYIEVLLEAGRYDEIRALAEKYGDVAANVDFAGILEQIAEIERIEADNRAFMQKVYDLMAAQDYEEGMYEVYVSEEAAAFIENMEGDSYIYFPDDNGSGNGVGAGAYQYGDDGEMGYYFYYGDYVGGERKGNGTEFLADDTTRYIFTGMWDKDAPNGEGIAIMIGGLSINGSGMRYDSVSNGSLIDGLWDGQVNKILTDSQNGKDYDLSFSAVKGMPTEDKTEEYLSEVRGAERPAEGLYIFAYDYLPNSRWWYSAAKEGMPVGIAGFGN